MENHARWKFTTTATGKSYLEADIIPGLELGSMTAMKPIRIATTQLEPPCPPESVRCMERYTQAEHSMAALSSAENVVFGGDMSWDDNMDLPFPLPAGWGDAWTELRSLNQYSWTYNSFWAEKIGEFNGYRAPVSEMKKRSDRFVCKLQDYTLKAIDLIEDKGLGICYVKKYKRIDLEKVELMRSCHRGLVLTIVPNEPLSSAQQHGELEERRRHELEHEQLFLQTGVAASWAHASKEAGMRLMKAEQAESSTGLNSSDCSDSD
uniref:Uncharacterized protein n=1 Tax=Aegilops tauschii TaxID=37682 RepID=M8CCU4_AEGTA